MRRPSTPIAPPPRRAPISETLIGAWRTSRPIASATTRSRGCAARKHRRKPRRSTVLICVSRSARPLEDRDDIAASWDFYARGNALMRARGAYRPEAMAAAASSQMKTCTREFFRQRTGWGSARARPDLYRRPAAVGLDIAGTDSRIAFAGRRHPGIAGHSRIVGELQVRGGYPAALESLTETDFVALGEKYLADTAAYRTGRAFFIDKMPNIFRHIGLIQSDAAERAHHRRPARADGVLLRQSEAAVRRRTGIFLRRGRQGALLPHLSRLDAPLGTGCCRGGSCACSTKMSSPTWKATSAACWRIAVSRSNRPVSSSTAPAAAIVTPSSEQVRQPLSRDGSGRLEKI